MDAIKVILIVLAFVSLVMHIVAVATTEWTEGKEPVQRRYIFDTNRGLFKKCLHGVCDSFDDDDPMEYANEKWYRFHVAMQVLGILWYLGTLAACGFYAKFSPSKSSLFSEIAITRGIALIAMCGFSMTMTGDLVFIVTLDEINDSDAPSRRGYEDNVSYSYILGFISSCLQMFIMFITGMMNP